MIARLDLWIGKHLFVPPIIRLCQATGWTQYACHTYGWMLVALNALLWTPVTLGQWLWFAFLGLGAIAWVVMAAMVPDFTRRPNTTLRRFFLILNVVNVLAIVLAIVADRNFDWRGQLSGFVVLFAEYALTITTIPPKETKEPARKTARSPS